MKTNWILRCIGISIAITIGVFLLGYVIMHLWNWLLPELFTNAQTIDYWQAMGILLLSKILFGGFHGRRCGGRCGHRGGYWGSRWKSKWEGMSEEERAKFRSRSMIEGVSWCPLANSSEPLLDRISSSSVMRGVSSRTQTVFMTLGA